MIKLSYSTINLVYQHPHNYINKVMGIKQPPTDFFDNGKRLHKIIQRHVSGVEKHKYLEHLTLGFPIVETKEFDPKCEIGFKISDKYWMRGYFDGIDPKNGRTLEIKTGNKMWSIGEFNKSVQRKIYCIALPHIKENVLVTAVKDDTTWEFNKPKEFSIPVKKEDKEIAMEWILKGIERIENIGYWKDKELEETNGVCVDRFCYWGNNCSFK